VINLGIKVPPEELIRAYNEHKPDMIGLSGLLVKSAQQMVVTAGDLKAAGIQIPLLVGGAALSDKYTRSKIAPSYNQLVLYAKDAMTGLRLANELQNEETRRILIEGAKSPIGVQAAIAAERELQPESETRSARVRLDVAIPPAPYLDRKLRDVPQLKEVWSYVNPQMLYSKHLGFKGNFEQALAGRDPKAIELNERMEEVRAEAEKIVKVKAVWRFFEAEGEGNRIHLYAPGGKSPIHTFRFPRQRKEDGLCLADYILPSKEGERDHVVLFVVGAGEGIRERSEAYKAKGEYLKSHALQALALESAEGCAEWLHRRIREDWGFPDPSGLTMQERLTAKYRGKRYSFGYPACPNLDDQAGIWKLINPDDIGVRLTEGMMMEPEASVSAIVFHHPDAQYFSVGESQ
jgi:5-methyltetrahydrofolate--homocysteine methyltransferase